MVRFKVACKSIRWNRKTFHAGEYLPESFTEKDKYRVLYPSRIVKVNEEVALKWLANGAIPSDTVRNLLSEAGVMKKFHEERSSK